MIFGFIWEIIKPVKIVTRQLSFGDFYFVFLISTSDLVAYFFVSELNVVFSNILTFFLTFLLLFCDFINLIENFLSWDFL